MLFVLAKLAFMLYNGAVGQGATSADFLDVVVNGLPHDLCVAACGALPFLFLAPFWRLWQRFSRPVALLLAATFSLALVADMTLYEFWDIKLDATVLAYLDSPRGVTSSVSGWFILASVAAWAAATWSVYAVLRLVLRLGSQRTFGRTPRERCCYALGWTACGVVMAASIAGVERLPIVGWSSEPLSVSTVYYSPRQLFNHSAVNPVFSFVTSVGRRARGISPDTFMDDADASRLFASLDYNSQSVLAPGDSLLTHDFVSLWRSGLPFERGGARIVVIVMEGCGGTLVSEVCGKSASITPCLNRLCREGVFFEECYANSFRTDRGVLCALSGYPAFPDVSVMRQSGKVASLPGLAAVLRRPSDDHQRGASVPFADFLYGGDRDFTSMADYLRATGYDHVWGDVDFPKAQRRTHGWGVTDSLTFERLDGLRSSFVTFLTLASHEPWDVPYDRLRRRGKIANAFSYLDHCLGAYVDRLRGSAEWDRTLLILIADHGIAWPGGMSEASIDRCHIPFVWTGGAIRRPRRIASVCNQSDLPATLLGQLGVDHSAFTFSRDVLSQSYTVPCAQHAWAEGFSFIDPTGHTIIDLNTLRPLADHSRLPGDSLRLLSSREAKGKAFLQTAYRDLEGR